MSSDLLPESVNLFLDDSEISLSLPILVIMVLCTAQFVFNHIFNIGYVIYQNVKKPETGEGAQAEKADVMKKLKGMLTALGIGKPDAAPKTPPAPIDTESPDDEEWEYCKWNVE